MRSFWQRTWNLPNIMPGSNSLFPVLQKYSQECVFKETSQKTFKFHISYKLPFWIALNFSNSACICCWILSMLAVIAAIFDFGCNLVRIAGSNRVGKDWDWDWNACRKLVRIFAPGKHGRCSCERVFLEEIVSVNFGDFQIVLLPLKTPKSRSCFARLLWSVGWATVLLLTPKYSYGIYENHEQTLSNAYFIWKDQR